MAYHSLLLFALFNLMAIFYRSRLLLDLRSRFQEIFERRLIVVVFRDKMSQLSLVLRHLWNLLDDYQLIRFVLLLILSQGGAYHRYLFVIVVRVVNDGSAPHEIIGSVKWV